MNSQTKNIVWNFIGATANAVTSLILIIIVTRINGTDEAGIFSYGFAVAIVLFCISNYITRPFQVTDISEKFSDSDYIYLRIITCVASLAFGMLFCFANRYDIYKSAVILLLCFYRTTEAFVETFYAIIQKKLLLYKAGISMFARAVIGVSVFFVIDYFFKNILLACIVLILVNVLVFFVYDIQNVRKIECKIQKLSIKKIKALIFAGFFNFILTALNSLIINISRYAIDIYDTNAIQAVFGYIIMPATFMNLFGQYIIQPALTTFSRGLLEKNQSLLKNETKRIVLMVVCGGIAVLAVAFFLEVPVLSLAFGIDFSVYKSEMMIIIAGSIMYALEVIISFILVAFRKTAVQAIIFLVVTIISTIISFWQVKTNGLIGAAVTYTFSMTILAFALAIVLIRQLALFKKQWNEEDINEITDHYTCL